MNRLKVMLIAIAGLLMPSIASAELIFHEGLDSFFEALTPEQVDNLELASTVFFQHPADFDFEMKITPASGQHFSAFSSTLTVSEPSAFRLSVDDVLIHEWHFTGTEPASFGVTGDPFGSVTIEAETFIYQLDNTRYVETDAPIVPAPTPASIMMLGIGALFMMPSVRKSAVSKG